MDAPKKKRGRPVGWRKHKPVETPQLDLQPQLLSNTKEIKEVLKDDSNNLDIVKCPGDDCPRKESCLRYTAPERDKYQAFFTMGVNIKDVIKCQFYWEVN